MEIVEAEREVNSTHVCGRVSALTSDWAARYNEPETFWKMQFNYRSMLYEPCGRYRLRCRVGCWRSNASCLKWKGLAFLEFSGQSRARIS